MNATLVFRDTFDEAGSGLYVHNFEGDVGYQVMEDAGLVRVWDMTRTVLVKIEDLVKFHLWDGSKGPSDASMQKE